MNETATADSTADQARDKAQEVGAQAKEKAQEAGAQARDRVRSEVDRRSTQAGDQAGSTAQALRQASDKLRQDGNEPIAKGMEQVAQRVESAGSWLRDSDGDKILREAEDFGRRNPLAIVAGGLALGFAASRLLKASSRNRYQASGTSSTRYTGNGHAQRQPMPPREGLTETGLTGGTPATGGVPVPGGTPATPPTRPAPATGGPPTGWPGTEEHPRGA